MIDLNELRNDLELPFQRGLEEDIITYIVALIREDVVKLVMDISYIARDRTVHDSLYDIYTQAIAEESTDNVRAVVDLFNDMSSKIKLKDILVEIDKSQLSNWKGPKVTPIYNNE